MPYADRPAMMPCPHHLALMYTTKTNTCVCCLGPQPASISESDKVFIESSYSLIAELSSRPPQARAGQEGAVRAAEEESGAQEALASLKMVAQARKVKLQAIEGRVATSDADLRRGEDMVAKLVALIRLTLARMFEEDAGGRTEAEWGFSRVNDGLIALRDALEVRSPSSVRRFFAIGTPTLRPTRVLRRESPFAENDRGYKEGQKHAGVSARP